MFKLIKWGAVAAAGALVVGAIVFGHEASSYARTSLSSVRDAAKTNVPIEFELRRARDLVDQVVPEMQANIRLIAQQEVEIANLRDEIASARKSLTDERERLAMLRDCLNTTQATFTVGGVGYDRDQVTEELSHRLELVEEAEVVLSGKERLLSNRQKSLAAAMQVLERTRSQKSMLEAQIASLESQHRLIEASAVGTNSSIDTSKLAQTQRLIADIKKQLDVAERVLAHESKFVQPMEIEVVDEAEVARQVDAYFERSADEKAAVEASALVKQ